MKYNKGFAPLAIVLIIVAILAIGGGAYYVGKSSPNPIVIPTPTPTPTPNPTPTPTPTPCTPSITILSPKGGETYSTGQKVDIKWTSCGIQSVTIGLATGRNDLDYVDITYPNDVSASSGLYQWTVTNPSKGFSELNTNSYQIVIESRSLKPGVDAKSGIFTVKNPVSDSTGGVSALPHVVVYKTKANYNNFVSIGLSTDNLTITSYPGPADVYKNGVLAYPTVLNNGYLIGGINKNSAFLNISYEDYSKLTSAPSLSDMMKMIIDKDPFLEIYDCGTMVYKFTPTYINTLIQNNTLKIICQSIK